MTVLFSTLGTLKWARTVSPGLEQRAWEELWRAEESTRKRKEIQVGKGIQACLQNRTGRERGLHREI